MGKEEIVELFGEKKHQEIQTKINEIRDIILKSTVLEDEYKYRILNRVEKLQSELHRRIPDFTRFGKLFEESEIAFRKFGDEVKPIFDRAKEILQIISSM